MTLLIYTDHLIMSRQYNVEKFDVLDIWLRWRKQELHTKFWSRNLLERAKVHDRPTGWALRLGLEWN